MRVRLAVDLPIIALGMSVALGIELVAAEQRWAGCGSCRGAELNALDRTVLGGAGVVQTEMMLDGLRWAAASGPVPAELGYSAVFKA